MFVLDVLAAEITENLPLEAVLATTAAVVIASVVLAFRNKKCSGGAVLVRPGEDGVFKVSSQWGLRLVCISDTHNHHRKMQVPDGDVLIHAGDFTQFGKAEHAEDFNQWLGELPHPHKVVIFGNHENNAPWNKLAAEMLTNAVFLRNAGHCLDTGLQMYGTDFFWSVKGTNPYFDVIPSGIDILIAHNPAHGCTDGSGHTRGCPALLETIRRLKPTLVVSGHLHAGHGVARLQHSPQHCTVCVNAANCGSGKEERKLVHGPIVIDI